MCRTKIRLPSAVVPSTEEISLQHVDPGSRNMFSISAFGKVSSEMCRKGDNLDMTETTSSKGREGLFGEGVLGKFEGCHLTKEILVD